MAQGASTGIRLFLTMALCHSGIADKVIVATFSITFGGIALALAIAFGWRGKESARNFLENLTLFPIFEPGGHSPIGYHLSAERGAATFSRLCLSALTP
jgi:hypothetical protein